MDTLLELKGLKAQCRLLRDEWGIPHVKATTAWDAFLVLGYAHAQDRLWQMDMQRRRAVGRWSEWVGKSGVDADILARRLGGRHAAERDYSALGAEARQMLDAYAVGVNAFIEAGVFPTEYTVLDETPEPWKPWHSIAVMRQIGLLMGSFWLKLFRAAALPALKGDIGKLRYDDGGIDLLCIPQGKEAHRTAASLEDLQPAIKALLELQGPDLTGGGSNNWAISSERSGTGRPILMGDPHRELEVPTIYTQAHIACDEFDAIGLTVPGVPGFPHVAHNQRVAWCVTHAFMDIHDLFIERFRNDGNEVLFKEEWNPTVRRSEVIKVRDGADVTVEIVETSHGPVILGEPGSGLAIAVRSMQFADTDLSFDCLPKMLKCRSVDELYASVASWGVIDHNLVAADVDGHIGHRVRAKVPLRSRANGWLPVPGWTGDHDWTGTVPFSQMPEGIDPAGGVIVTANNRVVDDSDAPYFCTDCHPPHRARRIRELIEAAESPSIDSLSHIYMDLRSEPAVLFLDRLRSHVAKTDAARAVLSQILDWDGHMRPDSVAPSLYALLRSEIARLVARASGISTEDAIGSPLMGSNAIHTHMWWVIPAILREGDTSLLGGMDWEQTIDTALEAVPASNVPVWADLHAPSLRHPLSHAFPDAASELDMSCAPVGGDNDTVFATGLNAGDGFATKYSALARTSFDVGNWDMCRWIIFQGASGVAGDAHRQDQNEAWAQGTSIPMLYDWDEITAKASLGFTAVP
ncbi:penicillin acylase family protein [Rhizobium sp.]